MKFLRTIVVIIVLQSCNEDGSRTVCDAHFCETYSIKNGFKNGEATITRQRDGWVFKKRTYLCATVEKNDTTYCFVDTAFSITNKLMGINYYMNDKLVGIEVRDSSFMYKEPSSDPIQ